MGMLGIKAKHDAVGRYKTGIGLRRAPSGDQERSAGSIARSEIFSYNQVETCPPTAIDSDSHVRRTCRADGNEGGAPREMQRFLSIMGQGDTCVGRKVFES